MTVRCHRCDSVNPLVRLIGIGHGRMICPSCFRLDDRRAGSWAGKSTCIEGFVLVDLPRQARDYFRAQDREHR